MRTAVYNSAIPAAILNSVTLTSVSTFLRAANLLFWLLLLLVLPAAADWSTPEQELARKIVTVTGPGAIALTVENRSSLGSRDQEIVQNGLRLALGNLGIRFTTADRAAAAVTISLSENETSYVWVAEIHQGAGDSAVVMVSVPRPEGSTAVRDSVPLSLKRISLWTQAEPILDIAALDDNPSPEHIAVLDPEKVTLLRLQGGKWQQEQTFQVEHSRPWPRDVRGRIIPARDHLFDVYLPGVTCSSSGASALNCHATDDPWPLVPAAFSVPNIFPSPNSASSPTAVPAMKAFFAPTRDFFTGVLTAPIGKFSSVPKFYSGLPIPREKYILWLFTATDGQLHLIDGVTDLKTTSAWGSDLAAVKTNCGAGWQVLATSPTDAADSIRAYEFPDRDPVAVSAPLDFSGPVTALWTEAKGDTAIAVAKNQQAGIYEAFRLEVACSQ
jgi:hypothetical protein